MKIALRRIMVAIDFSHHSLKGLAYARAIASKFHAEIELVHVVERSPYEVYQKSGFLQGVPRCEPVGTGAPKAEGGFIVRDLMEETRIRLQDLLHVKEKGRVEVRHGHVADELLAEIKRYEPDLVILCTNGWTGIRHLILGSVAEKMVRISPVPVLTFPGSPE